MAEAPATPLEMAEVIAGLLDSGDFEQILRRLDGE
ncbi:hypothetical protein P3T35_007061 [Kitasatospora sp. GP30]|nr:hypothetical protein [Kitasatospora sp. GP30]